MERQPQAQLEPAPQLIFLRYKNQVPVVTSQKSSISDIEHVARQLFTSLPGNMLSFFTKFSGGEFVRIDPAAWPNIYQAVTSIWIETGSAAPSTIREHAEAPLPPSVRVPSPMEEAPMEWGATSKKAKKAGKQHHTPGELWD